MNEKSSQVGAATTDDLPSRRSFLRSSGLLAGGALLAACGGDDESGAGEEPESGATPSESGGGGGGATPLAGGTVRVWTIPVSGPEDEEFQRRQFDQFMADNPDVDVELTFFPADQFGNAMQLAFTSGEDVPDVFRIAGGAGITLLSAYQRGWVQPLDEFVTDEFRQRFPEWLFNPANSPLFVDGEFYAVPRNDPGDCGASGVVLQRRHSGG